MVSATIFMYSRFIMKNHKSVKKVSKTASVPVSIAVHAHIISLFPDSFSSYLAESIIARAQAEKRLVVHFYNPRSFVKATGAQKGKDLPYLRVDDKPYGGGPGMVMQAEPVLKALEKAKQKAGKNGLSRTIFLSPGGAQFTNELAQKWLGKSAKAAKTTKTKQIHIAIICGRYEGVDERVNTIFKTEKISVGPFVTTGGELPAMIILDALARQIPGVLGNFDSREEARAASHAVYTRPEVLEYKGKKYKVPAVLVGGDHKKIEEWRGQNQAS